MLDIDSLSDFYNNFSEHVEIKPDVDGLGHFNVFPRRYCPPSSSFHRRDFFKLSFISEGTGIIHFDEEDCVIDRPALFFSNPLTPHSWEATSDIQTGWFCVFTQGFIQPGGQSFSVNNFPMFRMGENPVVFLDDRAVEDVSYIFRKMVMEMESDYAFKFSKLRNYLHLIVHEALNLYQDNSSRNKRINAAHRISYRFLELLEKQFPIENSGYPLKLRSVNDFASCLSVHVNHLNSVVKEITGKNPSQLIASRILQEAKSLLIYTDWPVSEIAYSLAFEYPSHFTSFFKKCTGVAPKVYRDRNI